MDQPKKQWFAFNLTRLLRTVFAPKAGERIAILIDLPDPRDLKDFRFLRNQALEIQRYAHDLFYVGLRKGGLGELNMRGGDLFAYQITGGRVFHQSVLKTSEGVVIQILGAKPFKRWQFDEDGLHGSLLFIIRYLRIV